jgi:hypothetical protein
MDEDRKVHHHYYVVVPVGKLVAYVLLGAGCIVVLRGAIHLYLENLALKAMLGLH